jgi:hypothetical protein
MEIQAHFRRLTLHSLKYSGPGLNRAQEAEYQQLLEELAAEHAYASLPAGTGDSGSPEESGEAVE